MNRLSPITRSASRTAIFIRLSVAIAILFFCSLQPVQAASFISASRSFNSTEQALVYKRSANPYIGITVENATGQAYTIADKNGKIILKGKISSGKTFFVATSRLPQGSYQFLVGGALMQQFIIQ